MKILVIGATGNIGHVAVEMLQSRGHEIIQASRSTSPPLDLANPASIEALFSKIGVVDGIVVASGSIAFKHFSELDREDYINGFMSKTPAQIDVTRIAVNHLSEGGSIALTSGILSREPLANAAATAAANGAIESFVMSAAEELPKGLRINIVSPDVLENSPHYHAIFPGHRPVTDEEVGRAFVKALEVLLQVRLSRSRLGTLSRAGPCDIREQSR